MTRTWLITGAPRRLPGPPLGWWPPGLGGQTDLPGHNTSRRETEETASTGGGPVRVLVHCHPGLPGAETGREVFRRQIHGT
ncbi:hypothetical protein AB0F92_33070 [Kitasatospora aureofaciens]|uniref:hypothetical protein n=1 Tax=Kitasatospora aureofaciens TaxID=1894 RepID=UPI0033C19ADB